MIMFQTSPSINLKKLGQFVLFASLTVSVFECHAQLITHQSDKGPAYGDKEKGSGVTYDWHHYKWGKKHDGTWGNAAEWRDYVYTGPSYFCDPNAAAACTYNYTDQKSVAYSYTVGFTTGNFADWGGFLNASFTQTWTNTKSWNYGFSVKKGWSAKPVAFVVRLYQGGRLNNAWVKTGSDVICNRMSVCNTQYRYQWRNGPIAGTSWEGHAAISELTTSYLTKKGYF